MSLRMQRTSTEYIGLFRGMCKDHISGFKSTIEYGRTDDLIQNVMRVGTARAWFVDEIDESYEGTLADMEICDYDTCELREVRDDYVNEVNKIARDVIEDYMIEYADNMHASAKRVKYMCQTTTILKSEDNMLTYKFIPLEEPIYHYGMKFTHQVEFIDDGIIVCQRLIEGVDLDTEIEEALNHISMYDREFQDARDSLDL